MKSIYNYCRKVDFTIFPKKICESTVRSTVHSVWKLRNLLSLFFGKNFVKVTLLLKKLLNSWFDDFFFSVRVNFCKFYVHILYAVHCERNGNLCTTVWKNKKFSLTEKKFSEINYLVIFLVKPLISRNLIEKNFNESNFSFSTVHCAVNTHYANCEI